MPRSVWILTVAYALAMCSGPLVILIGGLAGRALAPDASLATLPVSLWIVGTATGIAPLTLLMRRVGRKAVMVAAPIVAAIAALGCAWAINAQSFVGLCLGTAALGAGLAVVWQYRFAAIESVPSGRAGDAAARVLLGGLAAAVLGPELGVRGRDLLDQPFAGSFALLALTDLTAAAVLLLGYRAVGPSTAASVQRAAAVSGTLLRRPVFWAAVSSGAVGFALMSLIMTATPLSMTEGDGHSLVHAKQVVQAHILAMWAPSLVSGMLIRRFGVARLMGVGLAAYGLCIVIGLAGRDLHHYGGALLLLGVGWNLLFLSGTTLLPQAYREEERFGAQAFNDSCVFGTQALASLAAGGVLAWLGWDGLMWLALPLIALHLTAMAVWRIRGSEVVVRGEA